MEKANLVEEIKVPADIKDEALKLVQDAWKTKTGTDFLPDNYEAGFSELDNIAKLMCLWALAPLSGTPVIENHRYGEEQIGALPSTEGILEARIDYAKPEIYLNLTGSKRASAFALDLDSLDKLALHYNEQRSIMALIAAISYLNDVDEAKKLAIDKAREEAKAAAKRAKREAKKIARLEKKYGEDLASILGSSNSIINSTEPGFYFSLGYLAATTTYLRAIIPIYKNTDAAVKWFERFIGGTYIGKPVVKEGNQKWFNIYGPIFTLKMPAKAARMAPAYLTKDLAGTASAKFDRYADIAGALKPNGVLSNLAFIYRLVRDFGFDFVGENEKGGAPSLEGLLYYVSGKENEDLVKQGYQAGQEALGLTDPFDTFVDPDADVPVEDFVTIASVDLDEIPDEEGVDDTVEEALEENSIIDKYFACIVDVGGSSDVECYIKAKNEQEAYDRLEELRPDLPYNYYDGAVYVEEVPEEEVDFDYLLECAVKEDCERNDD